MTDHPLPDTPTTKRTRKKRPQKQPRRVTSQDVAQQAGVSRTTVSFVLNQAAGANIPEETRQRVLQAARDLGYTPHAAARALVTQRSHLLAFVLCQNTDQVFADAFLPDVLRGVSETVYSQGYRVLVEPMEDVNQPGTYINLVREQRVDGLILSGPRFDDARLTELREAFFPVVLIGQLPHSGFAFVDVDNVSGARQAVEHLYRLGHRRIAMITNAPPEYTSSADRIHGYQQALEAHGLPVERELIYYGQFTEESGYRAMRALLDQSTTLDAVFVASDVVAFGALAAIRERGLRIPQDIAVIGFDDVRTARYTSPALSTVHLPARELGARAATTLLQLIDGQTVAVEGALLETELVVRESCGAGLWADPTTGRR
jgi:DNA-binding LacI/PurR family transcriptional regulator